MRIAKILYFYGVYVIPSPCDGWNNAGVAASAPALARRRSLAVLLMQCSASAAVLSEDWVSFPVDRNSSIDVSPNAVQIIL